MSARPVYLNLLKIRLPLTGVISIAHRISGLLLFLAIPWGVYLLDLSLDSAESFDQVMNMMQQPLIQVVLLVLVWSLAHHFFAGIRYLLIDAEVGVELGSAKAGAWIVVIAEFLVVGLVALGWLL